MKALEGIRFNLKWNQLKLLPNHEEILEDFIYSFEWIKDREITREEAIMYINNNPLIAEVVDYGIHGLQLYVKCEDFYWNVFDLEQYKIIVERWIDKGEFLE